MPKNKVNQDLVAMWTCQKCGEELEDSFDACWSCGTPKGSKEPKQAAQDFLTQAKAKDTQDEVPSTHRFKTLSAYARLISGMGWLVVGVGLFTIIFSIIEADLGIMGIVSGGVAIVAGIVLVASGQLVSCIVAIQRDITTIIGLMHEKSRT